MIVKTMKIDNLKETELVNTINKLTVELFDSYMKAKEQMLKEVLMCY